MDILLDFEDFQGNRIGIPMSKIHSIKPMVHSDGTNCTIERQTADGKIEKVYVKETYEETLNYINGGKWERIK